MRCLDLNSSFTFNLYSFFLITFTRWLYFIIKYYISPFIISIPFANSNNRHFLYQKQSYTWFTYYKIKHSFIHPSLILCLQIVVMALYYIKRRDKDFFFAWLLFQCFYFKKKTLFFLFFNLNPINPNNFFLLYIYIY